MKISSIFANFTLYVAWALISSALLAITCTVDPFVFGFTALGAAWLSGAFVLGALIWARRQLLWAIASAIPTVLSFMLLSTYKWA